MEAMYSVKITNVAGAVLADITKDLVPLTEDRQILQYDDYLSSFGTCKFRVQTKSPLASKGLFTPYKYHIKVYRFNKLVWAGVIVNNPKRNRRFIEVQGYTYVWLFTRTPVSNPSTDELTGMKYREFKTGTMSSAITTIFNEGKAIGESPIKDFTLGTVSNPDYPWLKGTTWNFTDNYRIAFYYDNMFRVISSFADITNADFTVSADRIFTFLPRIGVERKDVSFRYGKGGNIEDYESPLDGGNFCNDFLIISKDAEGSKIITKSIEKSETYPTYGRLWSQLSIDENLAIEMLAEKGKNIQRTNNDLDTQLYVKLKGYPNVDLGDIVHINITDGPIAVNQQRRVIGWRVSVTDTMVESATLVTNNDNGA